jgi:hypothetical protein
MWSWIVNKILRPKWVSVYQEDELSANELGIRIWGVIFLYYKWDTPVVCSNPMWRPAKKREFGEVIESRD